MWFGPRPKWDRLPGSGPGPKWVPGPIGPQAHVPWAQRALAPRPGPEHLTGLCIEIPLLICFTQPEFSLFRLWKFEGVSTQFYLFSWYAAAKWQRLPVSITLKGIWLSFLNYIIDGLPSVKLQVVVRNEAFPNRKPVGLILSHKKVNHINEILDPWSSYIALVCPPYVCMWRKETW